MSKLLLYCSLILLSCGLSIGCADTEPRVLEQTMSEEDIEAMNAEYEAEMIAAEKDTLGEG